MKTSAFSVITARTGNDSVRAVTTTDYTITARRCRNVPTTSQVPCDQGLVTSAEADVVAL